MNDWCIHQFRKQVKETQEIYHWDGTRIDDPRPKWVTKPHPDTVNGRVDTSAADKRKKDREKQKYLQALKVVKYYTHPRDKSTQTDVT